MLFSVIVAAYNIEDYIDKCLRSILRQSYSDFEVIIVNDGSTDDTYNICKRYEQNDDRVKLISKENEGLCLARKSGVEISNAKYVVFVDGDDWLSKDALMICHEEIEESDIDIVQFGNYKSFKFLRTTNDVDEFTVGRTELIDSHLRTLLGSSIGMIRRNVWAKCYKLELLKEVYKSMNDKLNYGEDIYLNLQAVTSETFKKIRSVNKSWYHYRQNSGMMSKLSWQIFRDYEVLKRLQNKMIMEFELGEGALFHCHIESVYLILNFLTKKYKADSEFDLQDEYEKIMAYSFAKASIAFFKKTSLNKWKDIDVFCSEDLEQLKDLIMERDKQRKRISTILEDIKLIVRKII